MSMMNLFATPMWLNQLEAAEFEPLNRDLLQFIETVRREEGFENGARWQTPNNLQQRREMGPFLEMVRRFALQALEQLNVANRTLVYTGCWANINPRGASHQSHTHPNNYLSGVYYVCAPDRSGAVVFQDPRNDPYIVTPRYTAPNPFNSRFVNIEPRTGMLLLFPSWLTHSVDLNQVDANRVSISINMMFSDFVERIATPGW